jgi:hypothetical protein
LILLTVGCSSIRPQPFRDYHAAFLDLQASAEEILEVDQKWARESFDWEIVTSGAALAGVQIQWDPVLPYAWTMSDEPLYILMQRTQIAFTRLNNAFGAYTGLLAQLAGGQVASDAALDSMATKLNDNAGQAANSLGLETNAEGTALFSTAAVALAKAYINKKRKGTLSKLIEENQEAIDNFIESGVALVQLSAEDLKSEYSNRFARLSPAWPNASKPERLTIMQSALALNDEAIGYMKVLESLDQGYSALARKHAELGTALDEDAHYSVKELANIAKRLETQYRELEKSTNDE